MVLKILRVENPEGVLDKDHIAAANKSGSFSKIYDTNEHIEKLFETFGEPLYINAVPKEDGHILDFTGMANGRF